MSALQLEAAAAVLGSLVNEVVFVGGATVHLWVTEPGAPPARATDDVDVICEVATRVEYYRLGDRLRERGLPLPQLRWTQESKYALQPRPCSLRPSFALGGAEVEATYWQASMFMTC